MPTSDKPPYGSITRGRQRIRSTGSPQPSKWNTSSDETLPFLSRGDGGDPPRRTRNQRLSRRRGGGAGELPGWSQANRGKFRPLEPAGGYRKRHCRRSPAAAAVARSRVALCNEALAIV